MRRDEIAEGKSVRLLREGERELTPGQRRFAGCLGWGLDGLWAVMPFALVGFVVLR